MDQQENVSKYPKTLGIIVSMAYFLLFTFACADSTWCSGIGERSSGSWLRMIIPDIVVSEWAEQYGIVFHLLIVCQSSSGASHYFQSSC